MGKLNNKEAKMPKLTELEQKRLNARKALPDVKALVKKYGYETVNYAWSKMVQKEREVARAKAAAASALKKAQNLERQLKDEL